MVAVTASATTITASAVPPGGIPFALTDLGTGDGSGGKQAIAGPINAGGETISWTGDSGVYSGSTPNVDKSPFGPGSNGNYLAAEPGGTMTISFANPQTGFNLLWGSVDSYNSLVFAIGNTTITGSDIIAAINGGNASFGATDAAVQLGDLPAFTSIAVTSGQAAFEFVPGVAVPEPLSLAVLGTGLLGLGIARRRRRA